LTKYTIAISEALLKFNTENISARSLNIALVEG
jgi:hypothetical protein